MTAPSPLWMSCRLPFRRPQLGIGLLVSLPVQRHGMTFPALLQVREVGDDRGLLVSVSIFKYITLFCNFLHFGICFRKHIRTPATSCKFSIMDFVVSGIPLFRSLQSMLRGCLMRLEIEDVVKSANCISNHRRNCRACDIPPKTEYFA